MTTQQEPAKNDRYIMVDVESRSHVIVTCSPALDGNFSEKQFNGPNAYSAACRYAEKESKRLGCDWGANE